MRAKYGSSYRRCSAKKDVPEDLAKFTGKQLCQSLSVQLYSKKETLAQMFPCEYCETFNRTPPGDSLCDYQKFAISDKWSKLLYKFYIPPRSQRYLRLSLFD